MHGVRALESFQGSDTEFGHRIRSVATSLTPIEATIELTSAPVEAPVDAVAAPIEPPGETLMARVESAPRGTVETPVRNIALTVQSPLDAIAAIGADSSFGPLDYCGPFRARRALPLGA